MRKRIASAVAAAWELARSVRHLAPVKGFRRDGRKDGTMTEKHPYDGLYLQEVAETQGALFERLQDVEPTADGVDFVRSYMKSDTRALIDEGDVYLATIGSKGLMDYYRKEDRPGLKSGEPLRGFVPNWMGQFYAHYQWQTGDRSSEIVDAIPPEWLCAAYPGLHDLSLELAVEKVRGLKG